MLLTTAPEQPGRLASDVDPCGAQLRPAVVLSRGLPALSGRVFRQTERTAISSAATIR
jgi:hypothetical protein